MGQHTKGPSAAGPSARGHSATGHGSLLNHFLRQLEIAIEEAEREGCANRARRLEKLRKDMKAATRRVYENAFEELLEAFKDDN